MGPVVGEREQPRTNNNEEAGFALRLQEDTPIACHKEDGYFSPSIDEIHEEGEDPVLCCCCDEPFDTDISLAMSPHNRLPITCRECFTCTCCYQCLLKCSKETAGENRSPVVTCPECRQTGFDLRRLFPDRNLCLLLSTLHDRDPARGGPTKYPVGTRLRKKFGSRWYHGRIENVRYAAIYSIKYEDGDIEEMGDLSLSYNDVMVESSPGSCKEKGKPLDKNDVKDVAVNPSGSSLKRTLPHLQQNSIENEHDSVNCSTAKRQKTRQSPSFEKGAIWRVELDLLFPDGSNNNTPLPQSYYDVVLLMDALLGEQEEIDFVKAFYRGQAKTRMFQRFRYHKKTNPQDPGLSWHTKPGTWCPEDKYDLANFIGYLLRIVRKDKRVVEGEGEEPFVGRKTWNFKWREKLFDLVPSEKEMPKTLREVLQLMDQLSGKDASFNFEEELHHSRTRNALGRALKHDPNHPALSWRKDAVSPHWCPPDRTNLETFIEFLLELANRRRNGEPVNCGKKAGAHRAWTK